MRTPTTLHFEAARAMREKEDSRIKANSWEGAESSARPYSVRFNKETAAAICRAAGFVNVADDSRPVWKHEAFGDTYLTEGALGWALLGIAVANG